MTKLAIINIVATLTLAGVLSAAHMSPTLAASPTAGAVAVDQTAGVTLIAHRIEQEAPGLFDSFLDLPQAQRDRLLFRLADDRSMRLLVIANAAKPVGPMDAR